MLKILPRATVQAKKAILVGSTTFHTAFHGNHHTSVTRTKASYIDELLNDHHPTHSIIPHPSLTPYKIPSTPLTAPPPNPIPLYSKPQPTISHPQNTPYNFQQKHPNPQPTLETNPLACPYEEANTPLEGPINCPNNLPQTHTMGPPQPPRLLHPYPYLDIITLHQNLSHSQENCYYHFPNNVLLNTANHLTPKPPALSGQHSSSQSTV